MIFIIAKCHIINYVAFFSYSPGMGFGGAFLISSTIIQQHFTHNRGLTTGIAALGFSGGVLLGPIMVEYFLSEYSLTGAFLFLGAFTLHDIACGMMLISPRSMLQGACSAKLNAITPASEITVNVRDPEIVIGIDGLKNNSLHNQKHQSKFPHGGYITEQWRTGDGDGWSAPTSLHEGPTSLTGSKQQKNLELSIHSPIGRGCDGGTSGIPPHPKYCRRFIELLKNMMDFSLMKNSAYMLCAVYISLFRGSRAALMSQIVSASVFNGNSFRESANLVTVMGFSNIVVRITSAVVLNLKCINPFWYSFFGVLCLSAAGFLAAFAQNYTMFVFSTVLTGAFEGLLPAIFIYSNILYYHSIIYKLKLKLRWHKPATLYNIISCLFTHLSFSPNLYDIICSTH